MPRLARLHRPGQRHHITNRTSRSNPAFLDDVDRRFFLWLLSELYERFEVEVEAFCLMTNHFHLLIVGDLDQLARAMHRVGFLYTQYFNNRHELTGPLFSNRFYSSPVHDAEYHANAIRYIHRNPLAIDEDLDLQSYEWSSYGAYLGLQHLHWLDTSNTLELFGASTASFRDFVEDPKNDLWIPDLGDVQEVVATITFSPMSTVLEFEARRPNEALQLFCLAASNLLATPTSELARFASISEPTARRLLKRARVNQIENEDFAIDLQRSFNELGPIPDLPSWWSDSWKLD